MKSSKNGKKEFRCQTLNGTTCTRFSYNLTISWYALGRQVGREKLLVVLVERLRFDQRIR